MTEPNSVTPMSTDTSAARRPEDRLSHLQQEYESSQALFEAQPPVIQRFLETQARQLAQDLTRRDRPSQLRFVLPDRVVLEPGGQPLPVPPESREQLAGGLAERLTRGDLETALRQRLAELEQSLNREVAISAGLVRHVTALLMVRDMLPSGRSVTYVAVEGEQIPSLPLGDALEPESALTAPTDAVAEEAQAEAGRGELQVPYVPAARRFYLPQWVAFDDEDRLLVSSPAEAEAHVASMQRFLAVLHSAVALAPHILVNEDYQRKRNGMLGQLVNQGRALARYQTREIIHTIQRRAEAHDLNRGLSLSLPYFDDQDLRITTHDFEIIPAGRIMFVPAFVVRAARQEQAKVAQDTRLSPSTRNHLLQELGLLGQAFDTEAPSA